MDGHGDRVEVLLAGDVLHDPAVADRVVPFLTRMMDRGTHLVMGDAGDGRLADDRMAPVAGYPVPEVDAPHGPPPPPTTVYATRISGPRAVRRS